MIEFLKHALVRNRGSEPHDQAGSLTSECRQEAISLLTFWTDNLLDVDNGGFYGLMSLSGQVDRQEPKCVVQQARALWAYSHAAWRLDNSEFKQVADQLYSYISTRYIDTRYGGAVTEVDSTGRWTNDSKLTYAQALLIYTMCAYHVLDGNKASLEAALGLFDLVETKVRHADKRFYPNAFERSWAPANKEDLRPEWSSPMNVGVPLHLTEAYIPLYRITQDSRVRDALDGLAILHMDKLRDPASGLLYVHVDENYQPFRKELRPGHDVEIAWLMLDGIDCFSPGIRERITNYALESIDAVRKLTDSKTSTLYKIVKRKGDLYISWSWWEQAELMAALWHAWRLTGDPVYFKECRNVWVFIQDHFRLPDGEWMSVFPPETAGVHDYIAGPWKSLYHSVRALLEID